MFTVLCLSNATVYGSFSSRLKIVIKHAKQISSKDIFCGVAIFSLIGVTFKLFRQCINMRSEINGLRNLVAEQGHFDLENLRKEIAALNKEVHRQRECLRLGLERIQKVEDKNQGMEWQFQSLWKLFDKFTMENGDPSAHSVHHE